MAELITGYIHKCCNPLDVKFQMFTVRTYGVCTYEGINQTFSGTPNDEIQTLKKDDRVLGVLMPEDQYINDKDKRFVVYRKLPHFCHKFPWLWEWYHRAYFRIE